MKWGAWVIWRQSRGGTSTTLFFYHCFSILNRLTHYLECTSIDGRFLIEFFLNLHILSSSWSTQTTSHLVNSGPEASQGWGLHPDTSSPLELNNGEVQPMENSVLGNSPTPQRSQQLHTSTTHRQRKKGAVLWTAHNTGKLTGNGTFNRIWLSSYFILVPIRAQSPVGSNPWLDGNVCSRAQPLCWGLKRSSFSVITHSKNNLQSQLCRWQSWRVVSPS